MDAAEAEDALRRLAERTISCCEERGGGGGVGGRRRVHLWSLLAAADIAGAGQKNALR